MRSQVLSTLTALAAVAVYDASAAAVKRQSSGTTRDIVLDVVNIELAPDGFKRSMITVNGTYPGPLVTANKGDTLRVTVNNKLTDTNMRRSTSLDLDGLFKNVDDVEFDGSPFVTQCPIAPNASFTYEIPLDKDQAGSFWYHSSLDVQYADGFRGPLIIYDPDDPQKDLYDIDDESTIIQFGDHWHNVSTELVSRYEATGIIPVADSGVINGAGRYNNGTAVPFSVIKAQPGKRHRLRLISESARSVFTFSVDSHNFTIIAADGVPTQPFVTDKIQILAGQRYDVILNADKSVANYWINAPLTGGTPSRNLNLNSTLTRAILRYDGAPDAEPTTPMTLGPDGDGLHEFQLRPLVNTPPPPPDVNFTFVNTIINGQAVWMINGIQYKPPTTPTLIKILNGANDTADFNQTENTFVLPRNKVVQVDFPPTDEDDVHPFHLHGQNFWVIKSNTSDVVNEVNPIKRDTAGAGAAGETIRFVTNNAGPWFFHCHITFHYHAGLGSVFAIDPDETRAQVKPNAAWNGLCPAYDALPADEQ